jgi:Ca-activated chloride channel family protein
MNWLAEHHIILANPRLLWLLLLLPLLVWYFIYQGRRRGIRLQLSSTDKIQSIPVSRKVKSMFILPVLKLLAFTFFVLALSRPQKTNTVESVNSEGIDIVISLDISGSMLAEDFKPNRIEAAKATAINFVEGRPGDRIGLVIFAGESFTQCPITIDHHVLEEQIEKVKSGDLTDGTAIGMGLATAVDRLRNAKGKSKVVILMTDGVNNTGKLDPETALEIAKAFKVRVYTIGVGTRGQALYPVQTPLGIQKQMVPVEIDEALLKKIASETGGEYYRATGNKSLEDIYNDIDKLEKTKVEVNSFTRYAELFFPFAIAGICCLFLSLILKNTYYRTLT